MFRNRISPSLGYPGKREGEDGTAHLFQRIEGRKKAWAISRCEARGKAQAPSQDRVVRILLKKTPGRSEAFRARGEHDRPPRPRGNLSSLRPSGRGKRHLLIFLVKGRGGKTRYRTSGHFIRREKGGVEGPFLPDGAGGGKNDRRICLSRKETETSR